MADADDQVWISARKALSIAVDAVGDWEAVKIICKRCHDGLIRSRTEKFIKNRETYENIELPHQFWWARGGAALNQNWNVGDFDTWVERSGHWRAYGVEFLKADIEKLIPSPDEVKSRPTKPNLSPAGIAIVDVEYDERLGEVLRSDLSETKPKPDKGGRRLSELWPNWVAELTLYLSEEGIPEGIGYGGQSKVIADVESRLMAKGIDAPSRTTVQETVRAVLHMHRSAGN